MNLQTDNDMKRVLLFFSLMLLLGNIKGLAQSIVIDPVHIPADTRSAFPVISVQSPVSIQCCWQS